MNNFSKTADQRGKSRLGRLIAFAPGKFLLAALLMTALPQGNALAQIEMSSDIPEDPDAMLFVNSCLHCHQGIVSGTELINTHLRTTEALETAVRRMQQYTGPLQEEQIQALVELLKDPDVKLRIEDQKLAKLEETAAVEAAAEAKGVEVDEFGKIFAAKCAACHTVGGGFSSGGDLAKTATWQIPQLHTAIKAMENRVGPLKDAEVAGLAELLKDRDVKKRLASAGVKTAAGAGSATSETSPSATTPGTSPSAPNIVPSAPVGFSSEPKPVTAAPKAEQEAAERAAAAKPKPLPMGRVVRVAVLLALAVIGAIVLLRLEKKH